MSDNDTIHLLICSESQQDADYYSNLFRSAGRTTRAHRVTSAQDLQDSLGDSGWEILIATDVHPEVTPRQAIELVAASKLNVPVVVSLGGSGGEGAAELLQAGARDVVARGDEVRLVQTVNREIHDFHCRRELAELRVAYEETARRCELLLKTAQEAISYVTDGMHIHVNEAYASMFSYEDADELAAVPLVDLIAPDNQQAFKDALRRYRDRPEEETRIEFRGIRSDGSEFPASLVLSSASYEGEQCMQVLVRAEAQAAPAAAIEAPPPGDFATPAETLAATLAGGPSGHFVLIGIDDFDSHTRTLGYSLTDKLLNRLGDWLGEQGSWSAVPRRMGQDLFAAAVVESDPDNCLKQSNELLRKLGEQIHDLGEQSVQVSGCMAMAALDNDTAQLGVDAIVDATWETLRDMRTALTAPGGGKGPRALSAVLTPAATMATAASDVDADALLEQAIENNEFQIRFQPIVSLRGDSSEYYEVSIVHGTGESARAVDDWLKDNGLDEASSKIDRWAVLTALKSLSEHRKEHDSTRLIINLDAASILDAEFPGWLAVALKAAELPPDTVTFQLSVDVASSYLKNAKEFADRLRKVGSQLAVTEVNCSGNPLATLSHLQPTFVKLHSSISDLLGDSEQVSEQLKPLVETLHQQQMASIMPDVQSASTLAILWQLGIHFIQGDYLQQPSATMDYEFTDLA